MHTHKISTCISPEERDGWPSQEQGYRRCIGASISYWEISSPTDEDGSYHNNVQTKRISRLGRIFFGYCCLEQPTIERSRRRRGCLYRRCFQQDRRYWLFGAPSWVSRYHISLEGFLPGGRRGGGRRQGWCRELVTLETTLRLHCCHKCRSQQRKPKSDGMSVVRDALSDERLRQGHHPIGDSRIGHPPERRDDTRTQTESF
mmetsp:Transcript_8746/g.20877  ORF Transcript_8746/g.20877 Transcript_8746/m.20877 type:complete len:202 (-) Transcript_8746:116-721(-)